MIKNVCCFTGHRPEKLDFPEDEVKRLLKNIIIKAIDNGYNTFISGMARGIDLWSAEIVLNLKEVYNNITLICASPYKGFETRWNIKDQELYNYILEHADHAKYICSHYSKQCFQIRNVFMVDNSSMIISAYNGIKGGTKNTIDYATRSGKKVINIFNY